MYITFHCRSVKKLGILSFSNSAACRYCGQGVCGLAYAVYTFCTKIVYAAKHQEKVALTHAEYSEEKNIPF